MTRWSKFKKQITDLFCDELKERIGIYATVYRGTHDQMGKVWIELDNKVIFEANTLEWEIEYFRLSDEIRQINNCTDYTNVEQSEGYYRAYDEAEEILSKKHKMDEYQFYKVLISYLNSPFEESMQSNNDLARILCLLDKRLGKRRLLKMVIKHDDCDAVKILYSERCKCMDINESTPFMC
jgi:hypothetical protein